MTSSDSEWQQNFQQHAAIAQLLVKLIIINCHCTPADSLVC